MKQWVRKGNFHQNLVDVRSNLNIIIEYVSYHHARENMLLKDMFCVKKKRKTNFV